MTTLIIIVLTSIVSILCFNNPQLFHRMKFDAYQAWHRKEWYRLISYGLVHGSWSHLIFNMLTLYFFGDDLEANFAEHFGVATGKIIYIAFYISAMIVCTIADLIKFRNNYMYSAVGASGAVSAILFASILFAPKMGIYIYFIPIPIPAYIFAPLYLVYCWYMDKKGTDNIGHSAHFWGAVYGFILPVILSPGLLGNFFSQF